MSWFGDDSKKDSPGSWGATLGADPRSLMDSMSLGVDEQRSNEIMARLQGGQGDDFFGEIDAHPGVSNLGFERAD